MPPKRNAPKLERSLTSHGDTECTKENAIANPFVVVSSSGDGDEVEIDVNDVTMYPEVVYRPAPGGTESLYNSDEDPTHSDVGDGRTTFLGETRARIHPPTKQRRLRTRDIFLIPFVFGSSDSQSRNSGRRNRRSGHRSASEYTCSSVCTTRTCPDVEEDGIPHSHTARNAHRTCTFTSLPPPHPGPNLLPLHPTDIFSTRSETTLPNFKTTY